MAVPYLHLAVNTFLYFFIFVCGFAISIPIGVSTGDGDCLLYTTINPHNSSLFFWSYGQKSNCNFPIYVAVFGCIFYGLGMGIYNSYNIYKSRKDQFMASQMWVLAFIFINVIGSIIMLVCSCIISAGFNKLCHSLTADKPYKYFSSCRQARWTYNGKTFTSLESSYDKIEGAQMASWICTLVWTLLVISGIIRFVSNREPKVLLQQKTEEPI